MTFQCFNSKDPECTGDGRGIDDLSLNVANDKDYILMMTELSRNESPKYMGGVAANVSGIYISRVTIKSLPDWFEIFKVDI
ncbi:MAG: hypothetical protein IPP79_09635 [Chitinophagaceae bacterium]|nr:hypothetical protein [Chitinophagaceae bacterium]